MRSTRNMHIHVIIMVVFCVCVCDIINKLYYLVIPRNGYVYLIFTTQAGFYFIWFAVDQLREIMIPFGLSLPLTQQQHRNCLP